MTCIQSSFETHIYTIFARNKKRHYFSPLFRLIFIPFLRRTKSCSFSCFFRRIFITISGGVDKKIYFKSCFLGIFIPVSRSTKRSCLLRRIIIPVIVVYNVQLEHGCFEDGWLFTKMSLIV